MEIAQFRIGKIQKRRCSIFAALLFVLPTVGSAESDGPETSSTPSAVEQAALDKVAQRIAGYNSHDIDAFLAAHAEEVQIYEYPDRKIGVGREHLQRIFGPQFALGQGHVEVQQQIAIGNRVISYEYATIDQEVERLVVVYTVENGEITSFRLIESVE